MKIRDVGGEREFSEILIKEGKSFLYQPYLREFKIRPDFYCIDDDIYYEVIKTRQSYHARKDKINNAIAAGINIRVVKPNGREYVSGRKIDFGKTRALFIKDIPEDLAIKIKATAALKNMKIRELVIAAIEAYLQNGGGKK